MTFKRFACEGYKDLLWLAQLPPRSAMGCTPITEWNTYRFSSKSNIHPDPRQNRPTTGISNTTFPIERRLNTVSIASRYSLSGNL
jgi:hypothetical protein